MTKKHFIALADRIRDYNRQNRPISQSVLDMLADYLRSQNPRFMKQRWLDYIGGLCGPSGGKVRSPKARKPSVR